MSRPTCFHLALVDDCPGCAYDQGVLAGRRAVEEMRAPTDQDRHLIDTMTKVSVGPTDLVIVRTREALPGVTIRALFEVLRHSLAARFADRVFVMNGDEVDVEKLSDEDARRLLGILKRRCGEKP